jgi:hypothetical protein
MLARICAFVVVVMVGVAGAKVAQYAAVDYLGPAIGFDAASVAGLAPVLLLYIWLACRSGDRKRLKEHRR